MKHGSDADETTPSFNSRSNESRFPTQVFLFFICVESVFHPWLNSRTVP